METDKELLLLAADRNELYNTLTLAAFAIRCLRDAVDIGEKLPDTLARIDSLHAKVAASFAKEREREAT